MWNKTKIFILFLCMYQSLLAIIFVELPLDVKKYLWLCIVAREGNTVDCSMLACMARINKENNRLANIFLYEKPYNFIKVIAAQRHKLESEVALYIGSQQSAGWLIENILMDVDNYSDLMHKFSFQSKSVSKGPSIARSYKVEVQERLQDVINKSKLPFRKAFKQYMQQRFPKCEDSKYIQDSESAL